MYHQRGLPRCTLAQTEVFNGTVPMRNGSERDKNLFVQGTLRMHPLTPVRAVSTTVVRFQWGNGSHCRECLKAHCPPPGPPHGLDSQLKMETVKSGQHSEVDNRFNPGKLSNGPESKRVSTRFRSKHGRCFDGNHRQWLSISRTCIKERMCSG